MLVTKSLACQRGRQVLWSDLDLEIQAGKLLLVKGANGQGKSSLLRILSGISPPLTGNIFWNDVDITKDRAAYRENIFYLGHQTPLRGDLTALENLQVLLELKGIGLTLDMLKTALLEWGLSPQQIQLQVRFLSQGQRQRVGLSQLSLCQNTLWILDEPFNSLDSLGSDYLSQLLGAHLLRQGMVILTSHLHAQIPLPPSLTQGVIDL